MFGENKENIEALKKKLIKLKNEYDKIYGELGPNKQMTPIHFKKHFQFFVLSKKIFNIEKTLSKKAKEEILNLLEKERLEKEEAKKKNKK